jgi:hypothetical protein
VALSSKSTSNLLSAPSYQSPTLKPDVQQETGACRALISIAASLATRLGDGQVFGLIDISTTNDINQLIVFPAGQHDLKHPGYEGISYNFHGMLNKCYGGQDHMSLCVGAGSST